MTGYEIRNAMRRAYGFDEADHLFDTSQHARDSGNSVLMRLLTVITMAMKGAM
jgi:hypothetical protein